MEGLPAFYRGTGALASEPCDRELNGAIASSCSNC
jgi:hypothetical protein